MKHAVKLLTAFGFVFVLAISLSFAQSNQQASNTVEVQRKGKTVTVDDCTGDKANRSRDCALAKAKAAASNQIQRPSAPLAPAKVAVREERAARPNGTAVKEN